MLLDCLIVHRDDVNTYVKRAKKRQHTEREKNETAEIQIYEMNKVIHTALHAVVVFFLFSFNLCVCSLLLKFAVISIF